MPGSNGLASSPTREPRRCREAREGADITDMTDEERSEETAGRKPSP